MAIPKFLEDMNILVKLGEKPGRDDGLSPEGFKAKFDEAALKIQNYINETLLPGIEASVNEDGLLSQIYVFLNEKLDKKFDVAGGKMTGTLDMDGNTITGIPAPTAYNHAVNKEYVDNTATQVATVTLPASGWSESAPYVQTIPILRLTDQLKARTYPNVPDDAAEAAALAEETAKISSCKRSGNELTFRCLEDKPELDISITVEVYV